MSNEWVQPLLELQELDVRIAKFQEQLAQVPVKIAETQKMFAQENQAFLDAKKATQDVELAIRKTEGDIAATKAQKSSFQDKCAIIKNNDEYRAALLQIELCTKSIRENEDLQLELMEKLEAARAVQASREISLKEAKERASGVLEDLETRRANCTRQIEALQARRPELAAAAEPALLSRYERLRASRNANAQRPCVVPLHEVSGEESAAFCGRCNMKLPPQIRNNVHKGLVTYCPSCSAILYQEE